MTDDPIVAEVRRIREELGARFGYDIDAYFADLMRRQQVHGDRLVYPKKRRELGEAVEQPQETALTK